jgi:hypothetical protein
VRGEGSLLVLARGGTLWGVDHAAVSGLERRGGGFRIALRPGVLWVDRVVGVVAGLAVRPIPPICRRLWPEAIGGRCTGMTVYAGTPVVVIDAATPPAALGFERGDGEDGERDDGRQA